jgi:hypothetical protein
VLQVVIPAEAGIQIPFKIPGFRVALAIASLPDGLLAGGAKADQVKRVLDQVIHSFKLPYALPHQSPPQHLMLISNPFDIYRRSMHNSEKRFKIAIDIEPSLQ